MDNWKGKLDAVFLLGKITNNQAKNKPQKQRLDSLEYYINALHNKGAESSDGYCRICGHKGSLFKCRRDNYPLAGSGEFINFHHFHDSGLLICKNCLIKVYFLPLGLLSCGGNLMTLQIQDNYSSEFWQEEVVQRNLDKIYVGSSEGILKSTLFRPQNALFYLAGKIIERYEDQLSIIIRLLYFTNFGSKPDIEIYDLPNSIFLFLRRVLKPDLEKHWGYFIKRHFRIKSAYFDEVSREWLENNKGSDIKLELRDIEGKNPNIIFDYLLSGKSILRLLLRVHRLKSFPVMIAITYLKEVRRMRQEQIDLIRKIADKIIALAQKEGNYNKFLIPLEGARYASQLRAAILRSVKAQYKNGEAEPFIRFNDYVEFLFPDGQSWTEVRDFMLICLYERLHDLRVEPDQISDDDIPDIVESEDYPINRFNA